MYHLSCLLYLLQVTIQYTLQWQNPRVIVSDIVTAF